MKSIAIYGAGGFGREVEMLINKVNSNEQHYTFIGYFDDGIENGTKVGEGEVLGGIAELNAYEEVIGLVIAIGDPKTKKRIVNSIKNDKVQHQILIHPNVDIGKRVKIGDGSLICGGTIITEDIEIGEHVILNLACTVGHDVKIGSYCSFMPSVNISGEVIIEPNVFVGTGAQIINRKKIGEGSIIGAGAVVTKDIPSNCTAVGSPAKPIKFH